MTKRVLVCHPQGVELGPTSLLAKIGNWWISGYKTKNWFLVITARKQSLGKGNIFRSVCQEFCPQGGVSAPGGAWSGGMPAPKGVSARGESARGGACSGGVWWRPPRMAIAVGGMHPTGMHSCLIIFLTNEYTSTQYVNVLDTRERSLADLRGAPGMRVPPPVQSLSFSVFSKILQNNPNLGIGTPLSGKSWIHHRRWWILTSTRPKIASFR